MDAVGNLQVPVKTEIKNMIMEKQKIRKALYPI